MTATSKEELYSAKEVAEKLGWSYSRVIYAIQNGHMKAENLSNGNNKARYYVDEREIFRIKRGLEPVDETEYSTNKQVDKLKELLKDEDEQPEVKPFGVARKELKKMEPTRENAEILRLKSKVKSLTSQLMDILVELDELTK